MTYADLSPLANHLWQSTLFAAAAWLLTLALKRNRAAVRYWLWLAASVKFLVPFSFLIGIGSQLGWRSAPVVTQPQFTTVMAEISRPFTITGEVSSLTSAPQATSELPLILLGVWLGGTILGIVFWVRLLRQIRIIERAATPLHLDLPIPVMSSSARLEPGVFGIYKPVLVLPAGITEHLTPAQLEAILAHELCHVRRRDNLTAAIHMMVEVIFWFHPLVWWIRTKLVSERERACDEEVVKAAGDPQVYAEGILNVCKFYVRTPVACVSGVTGADLKRRIEEIMARRAAHKLTYGRRILLAAAGFAAVAGPVSVGFLHVPQSRAQSQAGKEPSFDVASVKPSPPPAGGRSANYKMSGGPGTKDPSRFACENFDLAALIEMAYDVPYYLLSAPAWTADTRFDIVAKVPEGTTKEQFRLMQQRLLIERFKLAVHREKKEMPVFELVVAKGGPKLKDVSAAQPIQESQEPATPRSMKTDPEGFPILPPGQTAYAITRGRARLRGTGETMEHFASTLAGQLHEPVIDRTGLKGKYDFILSWLVTDLPGDSDTAPTLFNALSNQLGLTLKRARGAVDMLVVDSVEKTPTEN